MMERIHVKIQRGVGFKVPRDVYDFEVPVLQAIHGPSNVEVGKRTPVAKKDELSSGDAWNYLKSKYDTKEGEASVQSVFFDRYSFESALKSGVRIDQPEDNGQSAAA
jgi:hypothetical protein